MFMFDASSLCINVDIVECNIVISDKFLQCSMPVNVGKLVLRVLFWKV